MQSLLQLLSSKFARFAGLAVLIAILLLVRQYFFPSTRLFWWLIGILILILLVVAWTFIQKRREQQANEAITGGIISGAAAAEASVRPDLRESYAKIRVALEEAIKNLEMSKPKGWRGSSLYRLPWVMVIGPPAGGKSTAMKNCGIRFPKQRLDEAGASDGWDSADHQIVQGTGGTRGCNWYFSSDAIILDTAGRWAAREAGKQDEAEWLQFLGMLRKSRPRRPVNGVIALCSIEKVLSGKEEARKAARMIRAQLDELMARLEVHVPIYLIFNKCDLIHGFSEFYQDLSEEGRRQMWGFTRQYRPHMQRSKSGLASEVHAIVESFDKEFEKLANALDVRRSRRLMDPQLFSNQRAALCIFPSEFRELRSPIRAFVETLFEDNPFGHNPLLRGLYFSSATQREGSPIAALMQQIAGDFDIPPDAIPFKRQETYDAYFLHDLMHTVVFPDNRLSARFKRSVFDKTRVLLAAGAVLGTLLFGAFMIASYVGNSGENTKLQQAAKSAQMLSKTTTPVVALYTLDTLRLSLERYAERGGSYHLLNKMLGLDRNNDLATQGRLTLITKIRERFVDRAWDAAATTLRYSSGSLQDYVTAYKAYLSLTRPTKAGETGDLSKLILRELFADVRDPSQLERHGQTLSGMIGYFAQHQPVGNYIADANLVRQAQQSIAARWSWSGYFQGLLSGSTDSVSGFSASFFEIFQSSQTIPLAYQGPGWITYVGDSLEQTYRRVLEDSVLRNALGKAIPQTDQNPLIKEYVMETQRRWTAFLRDLRLVADGSNPLLLTEHLGKGDKLAAFFNKTAELTRFPNLPELDQSFEPLARFAGMPTGLPGGDSMAAQAPLAKYVGAFVNLQGIMKTAAAPLTQNCTGGIGQASQAVAIAKSSVVLLSTTDPISQSINNFLLFPFTAVRNASGSGVCQCLNGIWEAQVSGPFIQNGLGASFPFAANSIQDADPAIIDQFFNDGGALRSFDMREGTPAINAGVGLSGDYLSTRTNGQKIGRILSPATTDDLILELRVQYNMSKELKSVVFRDANKTIGTWNPGGLAEQIRLPLPFDGQQLTVSVQLVNSDVANPVTVDGAWAPLKLLLNKARYNNGIYELAIPSNTGRSYTVGMKLIKGSEIPALFREFGSRLPTKACP